MVRGFKLVFFKILNISRELFGVYVWFYFIKL